MSYMTFMGYAATLDCPTLGNRPTMNLLAKSARTVSLFGIGLPIVHCYRDARFNGKPRGVLAAAFLVSLLSSTVIAQESVVESKPLSFPPQSFVPPPLAITQPTELQTVLPQSPQLPPSAPFPNQETPTSRGANSPPPQPLFAPYASGPQLSSNEFRNQGTTLDTDSPWIEYRKDIPDEIPSDSLRTIDGAEMGLPPLEIRIKKRTRYDIYRQRESTLGYIPGDGDQFGWLDFDNTPYLDERDKSGLAASIGLHLLSGPNVVPLPPRLWDFALGYQKRDSLGQILSYDVAANVGIYSDFEDSARDGVRVLGHAVGMLHANENLDWVFGVDYLDRDDYRILPVIGYAWHSTENPAWRIEAVFPRPRIEYSVEDYRTLYIAGRLGGGTWDIEMPNEINEVMTYRDFRLLFGIETHIPNQPRSNVELGWIFGRKLEFRDGSGPYEFSDAFLIQWITRN